MGSADHPAGLFRALSAGKRGHDVHYRISEKTLTEWRRLFDSLLGSGQ